MSEPKSQNAILRFLFRFPSLLTPFAFMTLLGLTTVGIVYLFNVSSVIANISYFVVTIPTAIISSRLVNDLLIKVVSKNSFSYWAIYAFVYISSLSATIGIIISLVEGVS